MNRNSARSFPTNARLPESRIHRSGRTQIALHKGNRSYWKHTDRRRLIHHAAPRQSLAELSLPFLDSREGEMGTEWTSFWREIRCLTTVLNRTMQRRQPLGLMT